MIEADRPRFADLLRTVYAYYRRDLSTLLMDLWWNGCAPYEVDDVQAALSAHLQDPDAGKYLPLVADVSRALRGTAGDRAALAWGKVRQGMADFGQYADVVFDDPAIHCAIADLGGWPKLCRIAPEDLGYEQHRFTQSYRAYTKVTPPEYPRVLLGDRSPDEEFTKRGLTPPAPRAVGDRQRCRLVYDGRATTTSARLAAAPAAPQLEHHP